MEPFKVYVEKPDLLGIQLQLASGKIVGYEIELLGDDWCWRCLMKFEEGNVNEDEDGEWIFFQLKEGKFFLIFDEEITLEELEEINNGYYELMRQIKIHPNYRLKVLNRLADGLREVWESV